MTVAFVLIGLCIFCVGFVTGVAFADPDHDGLDDLDDVGESLMSIDD